MAQSSNPVRCFSYLNADKAQVYSAIIRVFVDAKDHFNLHLRPAEVLQALRESDSLDSPMSVEEVEAALKQLCEWGNLDAYPDTAEVATLEEFYRPRQLYQISLTGAAVERAVAEFFRSLKEPGELQTVALSDIQTLLQDLLALTGEVEPDEGKTYLALQSLCSRFDELTAKAQTFVASLQRTIDLHGIGVTAFVTYKELLIDYLERFIGELLVATDAIGRLLHLLDDRGIERLLDLTAVRELKDAFAPDADERERIAGKWRARWTGLKLWFISTKERQSQSEILRARARAAIPSLLVAVAAIHDRRVSRTDRALDYKTLARWFATLDNDNDAHRLWRIAFGLHPSRHLTVNEETRVQWEETAVASSTSWLDAPSLLVSPRLRATGQYRRQGRAASVIDRSKEKELLFSMAKREAEETALARARLATGKPMLLSDLGELDEREFSLFLDLLGEALAARVHPEEPARTFSADGTLEIILTPLREKRRAEIRAAHGTFFGPDHLIEIRDIFKPREEAARPAIPLSGFSLPAANL